MILIGRIKMNFADLNLDLSKFVELSCILSKLSHLNC